MASSPPVCDYEGSDYRTRFWEDQGREYEDLVERVALRRLLPPTGHTLIEIGAGFGRLAQEYIGYERVVLFDYSRSLLREAQAVWGDDPRFLFVAGDWYKMPFVAGLFDTLVQVRTIHHAADVPQLFEQLIRIIKPNGDYVLEFANKHNLKAMWRYALDRQSWSPYTLDPIEFVDLNFDFHPRWIDAQLKQAGFRPSRSLTVSHFRLAWLKQIVPLKWLVALDALIQPTGAWWRLTPSVFVHSQAPRGEHRPAADLFFACPEDQTPLQTEGERLICSTCHRCWRCVDGLYDFKEAVHMDEQLDVQSLSEQRSRRAAEQILENSALRDNLDDEQAQRLIDWGLEQVEATVQKTVFLPDEEAWPLIEQTVVAVSAVMQQINQLVVNLPHMSDSTAVHDELQTLLEAVSNLQEPSPQWPEQVQQLVNTYPDLTTSTLSTLLLDLL